MSSELAGGSKVFENAVISSMNLTFGISRGETPSVISPNDRDVCSASDVSASSLLMVLYYCWYCVVVLYCVGVTGLLGGAVVFAVHNERSVASGGRRDLPGAMLLLSNEVNTLNEIIFTIAGYRHFGKTANSKETKYYESSNKQSNNNNETTPHLFLQLQHRSQQTKATTVLFVSHITSQIKLNQI